jgi:predicted permease
VMLMARLKTGVTIESATAEMRVLDRMRVEEIAAASNDPLWRQARLEVESASAGFSQLRDQFARPLLALMAIVTVLLLIACTNVAGMLLARGASRRREMVMRVALGAGRLRVVRQVLTESLLLAAAASACALVLAYYGADVLARSWPFDLRVWPQPPEIPVKPDAHVLLFTAGIALLTGLLFGMAPAWNALTSSPLASLREAVVLGETKSRRLFGQSLIVAQVALSVVLLSAAGLFVRHLSNLRSVNLGFQRESVLLVTLDPARSGRQRSELPTLYQELLERLEAIPGVGSVALTAVTPIEGPAASRFVDVEGFQENPEDRRRVMLNWVGPKYFETLGTTLVSGRDFQLEDQGRPQVAIINRAVARHYFGDRNPIGKRFTFEAQTTPYEIIGVVADAKYSDLHEPAPRTIYLNAFQDARGLAQQVVLRTSVPPPVVAGDVRRTVHDVLKTIPVSKMTTLADQVDASLKPERLIAMLSALFGGLGAALAAIGLYGLLAYAVARRTNEIGIRMALGATEGDIARMVLRGALSVVCAGLMCGAPLALWSRRFAASLVGSLPVETAFPVVLATVGMIGMALLAAYVPARRAARVQPVDALRHS